MNSDHPRGELPSDALTLLAQILDEAYKTGTNITATKFRADNYAMVELLDEMESRGFIQRTNNFYAVRAVALSQITTETAKTLISNIEKLYGLLRKSYQEKQDTPVRVSQLTADAKISTENALAALRLMVDLSLWCSGHSSDLSTPDAFVVPGEGVLKYPNFASVIEVVTQWKMPHSAKNWTTSFVAPKTSIEQSLMDSKPASAPGDKSWDLENLLHPAIRDSSFKQLQNGHLREAVMNAVTAVYDMIRSRTKLKLDGSALASQAFGLENGKLILSELGTESGDNDQKGFLQIYQGIYTGIRNPKAHTLNHDLDSHKAAQYLVMMSLLARRVDESKDRS